MQWRDTEKSCLAPLIGQIQRSFPYPFIELPLLPAAAKVLTAYSCCH